MTKVGSSLLVAVSALLPPSSEALRASSLVLRILLGVGGGYVVAALSTAVLSITLPMTRSEAVLTATMASFAIFTMVIVWTFAVRSMPRVLVGVVTAATLLTAILYELQGHFL